VVARFAKFESLQKAMTIHRTKPGIRVEPVAVGGTVWHYLGNIRCLFAHVHARVKIADCPDGREPGKDEVPARCPGGQILWKIFRQEVV
jgi:hypothetical protein